MAQGLKNDSEARALWGAAYDAMPKSLFAVAAWHLADCSSCDGEGAAERMLEEVEALSANGIITEAQAKTSIKAIRMIVGAGQ